MFEYITTRIKNKKVRTQLEQFNSNQFSIFFPNKLQNTPFNVKINLFEFTYQMYLTKPRCKISNSKRTKFNDHSSYLKRISKNNPFLHFDISDMYSEDKGDASEIIGESISRCLIIKLFGIKENSIAKIKKYGKRPDFKAITDEGKIIICESKGSFNSISQSIIDKAIIQKNLCDGDLKIAAINHIGSLSQLIDPPIINKEHDRFSNLIIKTNHYIQVFKLAGQQEITKYFKLMKKRYENKNMTNFPEFSEKQNLWFKLKYERQRKNINGKNFIGKVEFIEDNKIMFIGFDENLLNIDSFESFRDYNDIYINNTDDCITFISKDGVCFIEAKSEKLKKLFPDIDINEIKNYQESTQLSDIDNMDELVFSNYLKYVFQENNIEFQKEQKIGDYRVDYVINYQERKYYLELKLFGQKNQLTYRDKKKLVPDKIFHQEVSERFNYDRQKNQLTDRNPEKTLPDKTFHLKVQDKFLDKKIKFLSNIDLKHQILITNKDKRLIKIPKTIIVFDRSDLKKLLKNKNYFMEFLSNLE